ncbi:predicted permease [Vibrio variabilis]|uniref:Predicted permease n=1 Tax=Vibrio variabilis TaxID=990271 RepID=A0ABQ0J5I5_9VIBR|nr:predicted permease [Vibrio variabilis]
MYQWVTGGGIQEVIAHPWVVTGLDFVNEYLPFDAINPQDIAQKAAEFATSLGSNLVAMSAKILGTQPTS